MKRNIGQEIDKLKNRKEFDSYHQLGQKMETTNRVFSNLENLDEKSQEELIKYIPVSIVATLESLMRSLVKRLIDRKPECFENAHKLFTDKKKIDFTYFKDLHQKRFSFGEFVSHQVSCNNMEDLDRVFSTLISLTEGGFFQALKTSIPFKDEVANYNSTIFRKTHNQIMASVTKVFELRHIICHEMSVDLKLDRNEIKVLLLNSNLFTCQIYYYISEYLYPNQPETEEEYYIKSQKEYDVIKKKYAYTLEQITKNPMSDFGIPANLELFEQANIQWEKFRETYTQALLNHAKDDPKYKRLYLEQSTDMIDDRIMDLEFDFNLNKRE